ncbi:hypothetical protein HNQ51_002422 [Inhella inkyongensis]|uniref:Uncharacterized protein n=1 Tax=Inhella inkyongensis TaxID=392593 RepID=A0A840S5X7_9BURK|nr:hypothetical protein [Inhella inkyongensis]MBB5205103.1 hypothetical protein [Inhella inkyongensis]
MFSLSAGTWLILAVALGLLWALWTSWSGGWLKRWMTERSLRAAEQFRQPHAVVEPPEQHRAPAAHHGPVSGAGNAKGQNPQQHRSGQRHH